MIRIEIVESLLKDIEKKFNRSEANKILDLIESTRTSPRKGKVLSSVGGILVKELKYKSYRFYFLADGHKLKFFSEDDLVDILLRFVRMSDKKDQQVVIDDIKTVLRLIGPGGFR